MKEEHDNSSVKEKDRPNDNAKEEHGPNSSTNQKHEYINNMKEEHKHDKMWRKNMNVTKCKWKMQRCNKKKKGGAQA